MWSPTLISGSCAKPRESKKKSIEEESIVTCVPNWGSVLTVFTFPEYDSIPAKLMFHCSQMRPAPRASQTTISDREASPRPLLKSPSRRARMGVAALTRVVNFLESVDGCRDSLHSRFELKSQKLRVVSRLAQIAAMKPERLLLGGFPHVAQFPLPRSGVIGGVRPETPTLTNFRCNLWRDQIRSPSIHRAVTGGVDDQIGGQSLAVTQHYSLLRQPHYIHAGLELDVS